MPCVVYDSNSQTVILSNGDIIPFYSGEEVLPEIASVLIRFKENKLSLQETYFILSNKSLIDNWYVNT